MMNREEYINTLERCLVGKIDPDSLRDTIEYYKDYFAMEQAKGRSQEQIIAGLGEPRLLAKSIIAAESNRQDRDESELRTGADSGQGGFTGRRIHIPFALLILIVVLLFFGIISLVFSIASMLLPILLPVLIVFRIITLFKNRS